MKIAVYGTLKEGFKAHRLLSSRKDTKLVEKGFYKINYELYDNGAYPCLIESRDKKNDIFLEIYEINDELIGYIDQYEGYPELFDKEQVDLNGHLSTIYVAGESLKNAKDKLTLITNGNYGN